MKRLLLFLAVFLISNAQAQNQAAIDPSFKHEDRLPMFDLAITETVVQPDGKIIAIGNFTYYYKYNDLDNRVPCSQIVRLNPDLTIDESFQAGSGFYYDRFGDEVLTVALQADGKILVGGKYSSYNGVSIGKIIRLNSDGSIDNSFTDAGFHPVGFVTKIKIQSDAKILVAGYQLNAAGEALVRLQPDGSLDSSFATSSSLINPSNLFENIHLLANGKILAGGFTNGGSGTVYGRKQFIFNSDGSLDPAFNMALSNYNPQEVVVLPDNKILLTKFNGNFIDDSIVKLNSDGSIDPVFNIGSGFDLSSTTLGAKFSLKAQPDGKVIVIGNFDRYKGLPVKNVVRIDANGDVDPTFNNLMADNNDRFSYAKIQSDGRILACFLVYSPFDSVIRNSFLWLDSNGYVISNQHLNTTTKVEKFVRKSNNELMVLGSSDFSFNWYQNGIKLLDNNGNLIYNDNLKAPLNANYDPKNAIVQPDGKVLFIGKLPQNPTGTLMRFNTDFSTDSSFNLDASLTSLSFKELSLQADGKILASYKTTVSGTPNSRVVRLLSNGTIDATFNSGQGCTDDTADIRGLAVQADGKIIVCGFFRTYNGVAKNGIVRLNTDGTLDSSFNMPRAISWHNHSIAAMALQNDGKIVVGLPGGDGFYRLNPNGSIDSSFSCPIQIGGYSNAIAVQPDGKLLIGGTYGYSEGYPYPFYRVNTDGSIDTTFDVGTGFNDAVNAILVEADGRIMIGGNFTKYNGTDCNGLVRLNGTATLGTVEKEFDTDWVCVYPNPTSAVLNIVAKQNIEIESAEVYNLLGQSVLSVAEAENPTNIDISSLPSGHYVLKARTSKGVTTKKFIKL